MAEQLTAQQRHELEARLARADVTGLRMAAARSEEELAKAYRRHQANEEALAAARAKLVDLEDGAGCTAHQEPPR